MSYRATRRIILAGGLVVLGIVAGILYLRRVDTVEVVAVLLFVPVFVGFLAGRLPGGIIAAVLAGLAYAGLRLDAIEAIGAGRFTGLIITRAFGYLAFGGLGGWAVGQLERSLDKLDIYDQIDDATSLYNARFFLQDTDLEMSRAERYRTIFSVVAIDLPAAPFDELPRRRREAVLRDVGHAVHDAIRSMDRAVHARLGPTHRFAVICPETAREGAEVFGTRTADALTTFLQARGLQVEAVPHWVTFPGDDVALQRLREDFAQVEVAEHPEHAEVPQRHSTGVPPRQLPEDGSS